jgi:hypothetical protein
MYPSERSFGCDYSDEAERDTIDSSQSYTMELGPEPPDRWTVGRRTDDGKVFTPEARTTLRRAEAIGYTFSFQEDGTILATMSGRGTTYLRSDVDIQEFDERLKSRHRSQYPPY